MHFDRLLAPFWLPFGSILGPFWIACCPFGSILDLLDQVCSLFAPFWVHSGPFWSPFLHLDCFWVPLGLTFEKFHSFSMIFFLNFGSFSLQFCSKTMFFRIRFRRAPADFRQHLRGRQIYACTMTFRGPGAGICRRQLRSAPGPLAARQSVSGSGVPSLVPFPCAAPHSAPHPFFRLGYLQVTCDSRRAKRRGYRSSGN